jgi:O-antigen/teichoic acid export membrane protein
MFAFSSRLVVTNLVNIAKGSVFAIILGKVYSAADVGNFTQANKCNFMGWSTVSGMTGSIGQPVFARTAQDAARQLRALRKLLRFTAFVAFPAMFGLSLVSHELIVLLLTERWAAAADLLQWLCVAGAALPVSTVFVNLLVSRGRSDVNLWCSIALAVAMLTSMLVAAPYGITAMTGACVANHVGEVALWFWFVRREIGLTVSNLLSDLSPYLLLSLALAFVAGVAASPIESLFGRLVVKVGVMAAGYCLALWALRSKIFLESVTYIMKRWK